MQRVAEPSVTVPRGRSHEINRAFAIAGRRVGRGERAFIIAEAGVNHDGELELARALVREGQAAGADCVKFQTFRAERVAIGQAPKVAYQLARTDHDESQLQMLKRLELSESEHAELVQLCAQLGIVFLSTPYNEEDVDLLDEVGCPAFKLASIHAAEPDFVNYVARRGKPMVLSTGMATLGEVDDAVSAMRDAGNEDFVLLQCTTNYPSAVGDANVRAMQTLAKAFDCAAGYSDHTESNVSALAAVALGACVVEKHLTLDRAWPGPDHAASLDPAGFASFVRDVRETESALGSALKRPSPAELLNRPNMRRSIVARGTISRGQRLRRDMLTLKRPGTGVPAARLAELVGRPAARVVEAGTMLDWADVDWSVRRNGEPEKVGGS
jgi:N,N'-diacetyllegionaminate synthase